MKNNRQTLDDLFTRGQIDLQRSNLFDTPPLMPPQPIDFDRVEGMMLGLAIGDALGNTTESRLPSVRKSKYGEIRDYLPSRHRADGKGVPSDDTQLAFWTLEQLNQDKGLIPDRLAQRFSRERIFGIGASVTTFLQNYKLGKPWYEAAPPSAGNGALMRIAPILIPHLQTPSSELWVDTALAAMLTHNDSSSTAACLALIKMLWELLQRQTVPEPQWWLESYIETAQPLETGHNYRPRGGEDRDYQGPLWKFVQEKVPLAYAQNLPIVEVSRIWYSGAYLLETMPCVIYILMKYAQDPEEAIVRAVNDTKDNDTIAAIVGAAMGALYGKRGLPTRWIENLSGCTGTNDDGKVFALLTEARQLWAS